MIGSVSCLLVVLDSLLFYRLMLGMWFMFCCGVHKCVFMVVLTCVDSGHIYVYMWVCGDTV